MKNMTNSWGNETLVAHTNHCNNRFYIKAIVITYMLAY